MNIDKQIEFNKVKEIWDKLAVTDDAKDKIKEIALYFSEKEVKKAQSYHGSKRIDRKSGNSAFTEYD